MSQQGITSKKAKEMKALPLSETLRDLALLRASDVDLTSLLPEEERKEKGEKGGVAESTEFIAEAGKALKIQDWGEIEVEGKKVESVRMKYEELLEGLV